MSVDKFDSYCDRLVDVALDDKQGASRLDQLKRKRSILGWTLLFVSACFLVAVLTNGNHESGILLLPGLCYLLIAQHAVQLEIQLLRVVACLSRRLREGVIKNAPESPSA